MVSTSLSAELPSTGPAQACASPSDTDSHPNHAGYVSPTEILPLPKSQQPRKPNQKSVKTRILTHTLEKQATERSHEERKNKQKGKTERTINEQGKLKRKQTQMKITVESSSGESDVAIPFDDTYERGSMRSML